MSTETTYHIRRPYPRRGGNQYYKDRSIHNVGTYCGAEPTPYDVRHRDRAETWESPEHGPMKPCQRCVAALAN